MLGRQENDAGAQIRTHRRQLGGPDSPDGRGSHGLRQTVLVRNRRLKLTGPEIRNADLCLDMQLCFISGDCCKMASVLLQLCTESERSGVGSCFERASEWSCRACWREKDSEVPCCIPGAI